MEGRARPTLQACALGWELWGLVARAGGQQLCAVLLLTGGHGTASWGLLSAEGWAGLLGLSSGVAVTFCQAAKQSQSGGCAVKFSLYQISDHFLGLGTSNTSCSFATCPDGCCGYLVSPITAGVLFSAWQGGGL